MRNIYKPKKNVDYKKITYIAIGLTFGFGIYTAFYSPEKIVKIIENDIYFHREQKKEINELIKNNKKAHVEQYNILKDILGGLAIYKEEVELLKKIAGKYHDDKEHIRKLLDDYKSYNNLSYVQFDIKKDKV